jgi:hypothetical protein
MHPRKRRKLPLHIVADILQKQPQQKQKQQHQPRQSKKAQDPPKPSLAVQSVKLTKAQKNQARREREALAKQQELQARQSSSRESKSKMESGRILHQTPTRDSHHSGDTTSPAFTSTDGQWSPYFPGQGELERTSSWSSEPSTRPRRYSLTVEEFREMKCEARKQQLRGYYTHHRVMHRFLQHFAPAYLALGRCFHRVPFGARNSQNIVDEIRNIVLEAFTAPPNRELPMLVYIFGELGKRLEEAELLMYHENLVAADTGLRRCDSLLVEAQIHLRFLQGAVSEMWFLFGREEGVEDESEDEGRQRSALEKQWTDKLPEDCFRLGWGGGGAAEFQAAGGA